MRRRPNPEGWTGIAVALWLASPWAASCTDSRARYQAFVERSAAMRSADQGEGGAPMTGERFDFGGDYVLALSTTLSPQQPILLSLEAEVADDLDTLDLTFQALSTAEDPEPLSPVGEPVHTLEVPYLLDGGFSVDLGEVVIPGRANPISGSEIIANVQLRARALPAEAERPRLLCGLVSGDVSKPLLFDLAGSTFGAIPASAPVDEPVPTSCPDGP